MTSAFIGHFIQATKLRIPTSGELALLIPSEVRNQVEILKQITRDYILSAQSLAAQQKGQRRILTELFDDLYDAGAEKYLPKALRLPLRR